MTDHEKIILELREENKRLQLLINDLIKSNDELKQKLAYYENSHHLKIPYNGENKRQRKDKTEKMENQIEAAYQVTKVQHRNSSHKRHSMNLLHRESDLCKGSTDTPQAATPIMLATVEPTKF